MVYIFLAFLAAVSYWLWSEHNGSGEDGREGRPTDSLPDADSVEKAQEVVSCLGAQESEGTLKADRLKDQPEGTKEDLVDLGERPNTDAPMSMEVDQSVADESNPFSDKWSRGEEALERDIRAHLQAEDDPVDYDSMSRQPIEEEEHKKFWKGAFKEVMKELKVWIVLNRTQEPESVEFTHF